MKIGILVNGGIAPGTNAIIEGATKAAYEMGCDVSGFIGGYFGAHNNDVCVLTPEIVDGIRYKAGSILLTSRMNPYKDGDDEAKVIAKNIEKDDIDGVITIGGGDTQSVGLKLYENDNIPVVACIKTVDNDLDTRDGDRKYPTVGFFSGVEGSVEYVNNLIPAALGHCRLIIGEIPGRDTGWLTLYTSYRVRSIATLIPERPFDLDVIAERTIMELDSCICQYKKAIKKGIMPDIAEYSPIILVSEGVKLNETPKTKPDGFGNERKDRKRIVETLEKSIRDSTCSKYNKEVEIRTERVGRIVNGREPIPFDVNRGMMLGKLAVELFVKDTYGVAPLDRRKDGSIVTKNLKDLVRVTPVSNEIIYNCQKNGLNFG